MDPASRTFTVPEIVDAWEASLRENLAIAESLDDAEWSLPTPCEGWSAGDMIAHLADVESYVSGDPRPEHVPDWERLPQAADAFSQFTETGVDYRRTWPRQAVIDELRERIGTRRAQLDAVPDGGLIPGLFGDPVPVETLLRMRTFDSWVHQQDVRAAIGREGGWGSVPATVAFQQMSKALPYSWARNAKAPGGASARVTVTGPELETDATVVVDDSGRGRFADPVDAPTVHLVTSWPDYMRLCCGRVAVDDAGLRARITLAGDHALGEALLRGLSIAP